MPRIAASLTLILVALTGACTTTHHVARPDNLPELKERVAAQRTVSVLYAPELDGPEVVPPGTAPGVREPARRGVGKLVEATDSGLVVEHPLGMLKLSLPDTRGYVVINRGTGAAEGLTLGLLTGIVAGIVVGLADGDDPKETCFVCFTAGQKAAFAGAALGVTGAVTGAVFGAIVGHKDRYVF